MKLRILALIVFWLASIVLFGSSALSNTLYGLHMDLNYIEDPGIRKLAIEKAKELNVQVSRNSFLWHRIEAEKGARDWSVPDSVVQELLAAGIEPLFCIYGSPLWANNVDTNTEKYYLYIPAGDQAFQEWLKIYKDFVTDAVQRYRGEVKMWELWNEPNEHFFWKPSPNIEQYAMWYREIYKTIKKIDPNAKVALGGLAALAYSGSVYTGKVFLQELYDRGVFPDIISIHPYPSKFQAPDVHIPWEGNFDDVELIYKMMASYEQGDKEIWITEWGWPTNKIDEATQADYLLKSLEMINSLYPFVSVATYFIDYDRPPEYYHGLYTRNFRLKEAGMNFRDFLRPMLPPPKHLCIQSIN